LDNYDGPAIATIAIEYGLYEEALEIYRKHNLFTEAMNLLLNNIGDINRAAEFAEKINKADVWSLLGHAFINNYQVNMALECYLKSNETSTFGQVIGLAE